MDRDRSGVGGGKHSVMRVWGVVMISDSTTDSIDYSDSTSDSDHHNDKDEMKEEQKDEGPYCDVQCPCAKLIW